MELKWKHPFFPSPLHSTTHLKRKTCSLFLYLIIPQQRNKTKLLRRKSRIFLPLHLYMSFYFPQYHHFTKQILMSVRLVSDPSQDTHLTSHTILCLFFFFFSALWNRIDKMVIICRRAFFISSAKNLLLETWLQSQPAWSGDSTLFGPQSLGFPSQHFLLQTSFSFRIHDTSSAASLSLE